MTKSLSLPTLALVAALLTAPLQAHAWWDKAWTERARITLNTSAQGLPTQAAANGVMVAVRLHSGNFDFVAAKEDGSDLRVVAGDDKTPLKFSVERYDGINELAVLWVQVPTVAAGSEKNNLYVYAGNAKAVAVAVAVAEAAAPASGGFDAATLAALHFSQPEQTLDNPVGLKPTTPLTLEPNGLLAGSLRLSAAPVAWLPNDRLKVDAGGAVTVSLWIKPNATASGTVFNWGAIGVALQGGKLVAHVDKATLAGGEVAPTAWSQVALTVGAGQAVLYLNGADVAHAAAQLPALGAGAGAGSSAGAGLDAGAGAGAVGGAGARAGVAGGALQIGGDLAGLADELQIATTARSAEWIKVAAGAQGAESKLVASVKETGDTADAASPGYFGILVKNLTTDAWVVIGLLGVMFLVAVWVMVTKTSFVLRADKGNRQFLERFRGASADLLQLERGGGHANSSLYRLYLAGVRELNKRQVGVDATSVARNLSGASLNAVKASVDADLVRESHRLNAQMVFLTIAISGGPFLGLLGTVVGVMITFAAIAAAGDVNVNAIAPGIAAALLATVAGLAVAIPALFGYNYLASRIKNISADMQIFVDEFVTRVAETYGTA